MLAPFECLCGNFILPEPASYVFFYAFSNLRHFVNRSLIVHYPLMISALKIRQRKFNFGQIPENMGTANLPLARKLGGIPPASEFYREICLFLLTCKSKCKFVRVNATAKFKNFDSLLQIWENSLFNGIECVKINSIRQEIGKMAKNSQRSDCRLLFCKGKSHP